LQEWITLLFFAGLASGTPIILAALGGLLCERAGVSNIALEGIMLIGAVSSFMVVHLTGNKFLALLVVLVACGLIGLLLGALTITFQSNQIVAGLAVVMFCTGLSSYLGKELVGQVAKNTFTAISIPLLGDIPFIGKILFQHNILVYGTFLLVFLIWFLLYRTKEGLNIRAVGDCPATADSLGVNVYATRYKYMVIGSMLPGLGGAYLSLAHTPSWSEGMTGGLGWIAVALVVLATWDPVKVIIGGFLIGIVTAFSFRMQALGIEVPSYFVRMIPYLLPIIVLMIATLRQKRKYSIAPRSLCIPYKREAR
jgi:simple sugar transport system permease protein